MELARQAKRATLDNANNSQMPALSEAETADAESFLADVMSIFPLLGLTVFEKTVVAKSSSRHEFKIEAKGITAKGYETPDSFVVLKGSTVVNSEVPSIHRYLSDLWKDLQSQGCDVFQRRPFRVCPGLSLRLQSTAVCVKGR